MKIEIITTKKKLSKSLIKQMDSASCYDFTTAMSYDDTLIIGSIFRVSDVYKWDVYIFQKPSGEWVRFPLLEYHHTGAGIVVNNSDKRGDWKTLVMKGDDASSFPCNLRRAKRLSTKLFI